MRKLPDSVSESATDLLTAYLTMLPHSLSRRWSAHEKSLVKVKLLQQQGQSINNHRAMVRSTLGTPQWRSHNIA